MADTIINTPAQSDGGAAGWVVAILILIAVLFGGFYWFRYYRAPATAKPQTILNVTVPAPVIEVMPTKTQ